MHTFAILGQNIQYGAGFTLLHRGETTIYDLNFLTVWNPNYTKLFTDPGFLSNWILFNIRINWSNRWWYWFSIN